jgi:catechol 2,3-dioxygenase-like lactoylglutathione lyase family enzyme
METTKTKAPGRLHHNAYVTSDLEATRKFYEDIIGMPLMATWCEKTDLFGKVRTYCHCFFGLSDGSALAFFQFADAEDHAEFGPEIAESPFHHIALHVTEEQQNGIRERLHKAGYSVPGNYYELEHGYCHSLYVWDPNRLIVEFTVDHPEVETINRDQAKKAHAELKRWLGGDHTPNNEAYHRQTA